MSTPPVNIGVNTTVTVTLYATAPASAPPANQVSSLLTGAYNVWLNDPYTPGDRVMSWTTPGFTTAIGNFNTTGTLTEWLDLDKELPNDSALTPFETLVNDAEQLIEAQEPADRLSKDAAPGHHRPRSGGHQSPGDRSRRGSDRRDRGRLGGREHPDVGLFPVDSGGRHPGPGRRVPTRPRSRAWPRAIMKSSRPSSIRRRSSPRTPSMGRSPMVRPSIIRSTCNRRPAR